MPKTKKYKITYKVTISRLNSLIFNSSNLNINKSISYFTVVKYFDFIKYDKRIFSINFKITSLASVEISRIQKGSK